MIGQPRNAWVTCPRCWQQVGDDHDCSSPSSSCSRPPIPERYRELLEELHAEFYGGPPADADAFRILPKVIECLDYLSANVPEVDSSDLFAELAEWVEYTETRTRELDKLAEENKRYPEAHARLETKAGSYRSLATEVKRILKANSGDRSSEFRED